MHRRSRAVLLGLMLVLFSHVPALGQRASTPSDPSSPHPKRERRTLEATRIAGVPPIIDGRLDDAEWSRAEVAGDFIQVEPRSGAAATERTEARVLYDGHAIYIGVRLYDAAPRSIVARLARRDEEVYSDWISVQLDTYHDRRTGVAFGVNPRGVKWDALLLDDTDKDESWDAVWDVATREDALGWTAEFRIPFSQLRYNVPDDTNAEQVWGINFQRVIARRGERSNWSPIPRDAGRYVSVFGELRGLRGLKPSHRLEILPYSVARLTRAPGESKDPFYRANDLFQSAGADLRYGLTSSLTLTGTLNPDFGQVEADPSVVNLTAYETFFPEKRPFFLEGLDAFSSTFGDVQLFYSRRIGRSPQRELHVPGGFVKAPESSTILGAAKLSGRTADGWSIGVLEAVTDAEKARVADSLGAVSVEPVEPLTNYAVARIGKNFGEGQSTVGAIFTATNRRLNSDGLDSLRSAAYAGGVDVRHRLLDGTYEVSGSLLGSYVRGSRNAIARVQGAAGHYFQRPDAKYLTYDSTRTSLGGLAADLSFTKIGGGHWTWGISGRSVSPGFEVNDLGFQKEADRVSQGSFLNYNQYDPGRVFRNWNVGLNQAAAWSFGGERLSTSVSADFTFQFLNYWGGSIELTRSFPALAIDALRGGPALVTPGGTYAGFSLYSDDRRAVGMSLSGNVSTEDETGDRSVDVGVSLTVRPSARMQLSLEPYFSRTVSSWQYVSDEMYLGRPYYVFARTEQPTASVTTRLSYTFTPTLSLQLYMEPFVGAANYSEFKEVRDPRAPHFRDRFRSFGTDAIAYDPSEQAYTVDIDGDHTTDLFISNPNFSVNALNSNVVLRWEYRPGSALYLVWSRGRSGYRPDGSFRPGRDFAQLFDLGGAPHLPSTNVLLVKVSYWLGF